MRERELFERLADALDASPLPARVDTDVAELLAVAEWGNIGPDTLGGTSISVALYVEDVDAVFARAVAAGATVLDPVQDYFYGDRGGKLKDPFGHRWMVATHKEDVSIEEMQRRM